MDNTTQPNTSSLFKRVALGVQFLFVAFGATVLVPILISKGANVDFSTTTALFTAGVGTLLFHLITKGKVPIFLGSSFAFIAPIIGAIKAYGYEETLSGLMAVGIFYIIFSFLVKAFGVQIISKIFPAVVVGPVIMLIGLSLAPVAVDMASKDWLLALITFITAVVIVIFGKGFFKLIPIFLALVVGYIVALMMGKVDYSGIADAPIFAMPHFVFPKLNWGAIFYMLPVAVAPLVEHVGDIYAYSEVTGAIELTNVKDPRVLRITGITALIFSFLGVVATAITTIPTAVIGGVMLLLFGMIASVGIKTIISHKVDFDNVRNQVIVSVILVVGIGGAVLPIHAPESLLEWINAQGISIESFNAEFSGVGLASIVGVFLNLVLPSKK